MIVSNVSYFTYWISELNRSTHSWPDLKHDKRKAIPNFQGSINVGFVNHYSREYKTLFEERAMTMHSPVKQHFALDLNYMSKQLKIAEKRQQHSLMAPRSPGKGFTKNLGHDLDQLTKQNSHEIYLSPHPSMTIMVQPNKIDYTERCKHEIQ